VWDVVRQLGTRSVREHVGVKAAPSGGKEPRDVRDRIGLTCGGGSEFERYAG